MEETRKNIPPFLRSQSKDESNGKWMDWKQQEKKRKKEKKKERKKEGIKNGSFHFNPNEREMKIFIPSSFVLSSTLHFLVSLFFLFPLDREWDEKIPPGRRELEKEEEERRKTFSFQTLVNVIFHQHQFLPTC